MGKFHHAVAFSRQEGCYTRGQTRLKGVLATLTRRYFRQIPCEKKPKHMSTPDCGTGKRYKVTGKARGKLVGNQLTRFANNRRYKPSRVHPYTQMVLDELKSRDWQLWKGEMVVADGKLATGVDLVAVDADRRIHAIELKTGRHTNFKTVYGQMKLELSAISNSAYSQACLQLAVTVALLRRQHPQADVGGSWLFHTSDTGVRVYPLPQWAKAAAQRVLEQIG